MALGISMISSRKVDLAEPLTGNDNDSPRAADSQGRRPQGSGRVVFGRPKKIDVKAAKTVKTLKSEERLSVPEISIRTGLSVASVYRALRA